MSIIAASSVAVQIKRYALTGHPPTGALIVTTSRAACSDRSVGFGAQRSIAMSNSLAPSKFSTAASLWSCAAVGFKVYCSIRESCDSVIPAAVAVCARLRCWPRRAFPMISPNSSSSAYAMVVFSYFNLKMDLKMCAECVKINDSINVFQRQIGTKTCIAMEKDIAMRTDRFWQATKGDFK